EGEWGSQIVEELKPNPRDRIILKRRYSAFLYTDLDLYLRERGINTLYLSGVATNVCVLYTAADAFMRGYEVKVIEDCVASFSKEDHEFAIKQMREILKAEIVRSEEICTQR
ncbi:cysteine hydrolase, partial [Thermococci archaeon]